MRELQGDYEPSPFPPVREQVERYEATAGREGGTLEGRPVIILTHRGARSGKLRKTPVMKIKHAGRYIVVASMGGAPVNPTWYHNLRANPLVEVQDGANIMTMLASEAPAEQTNRLWEIAEAAWPHFPEYRARTDREIPIFLLEQQSPAEGEAEAPKEAQP
jgi:F420H(2)-dependent quinone reductase